MLEKLGKNWHVCKFRAAFYLSRANVEEKEKLGHKCGCQLAQLYFS